MNNIVFLHSFHFLNIPENSYRLCEKSFNIVDNNNNKLCGLLNIPKNRHLYSIKLVPISNPFHNLKIQVELDYDCLYNLILCKKNIPDKTELIKLLKKEYWKTYEEFTRKKDILYNELSSIKENNFFFIKKNYIQFREIVVNTVSEQFHIVTRDNKHLFYVKNIGFQYIMYSYPYKNIINQLNKNKYLESLLKKRNNLIITSKINKEFLNNIPNTKIISSVNDLEYIIENPKIIIIYDTFFQKYFDKLVNISWNSVILLNISIPSINSLYTSIKSFNKFIFFNSLENYYFKPDHFKLFDIILNKEVCNLNKNNLNKIINNFILLKQEELNYSKKIFTLQEVDKKFLKENESNTECIEQFYSLKENFLYYTLVDFNIFKKNEFVNTKIFQGNKYADPECAICLEKIKKSNLLYTKCNHFFCHSCIITYFKMNDNIKKCPLCRRELEATTLLKIRYNKNTNYTSNKLKYILSLTKGNILIISYYTKSINKLNMILENWDHTNKFTIVSMDNIHKLHLITKNKIFNKVLFLEDKGEQFKYYNYFVNNVNKINKKNVQILSIKD